MEQLRKVSLQDFLAGTECRFESIRKQKYVKCLYKIDGKKYRAKICLETGVIRIGRKVVRRCMVR